MSRHYTILSSLSPFIRVAKFHGALPFQFKSSGVKISKFGLVYGVCLCTIAISYTTYYFISGKQTFLNASEFHERVFKVFIFLVGILATGSFLSYVLNVRNVQNLYEESLPYSKYLYNDQNYRKKIFLLSFSEVSLFLLINFIYFANPIWTMIIMTIEAKKNDTVSDLYLAILFLSGFTLIISYHYMLFIITLINLQFNKILLLYSVLFNIANKDLLDYLELTKTFTVRKSVKKEAVLTSEDGNISKLVDFYGDICDLCRRANKYFNVSLLLSSILTFGVSLESLYFLASNKYPILNFTCQFSYSLLNLWFILYCCESVVTATKESGILIHRLLSKTEDQRLKEQLQHFSLQLIHGKIKFTACGLFPLNYTLIYAIAGLVTTYLVILIQFQGESVMKPTIRVSNIG